MEEQFKDAEKSFEELKIRFRQGDISRREFINRLKKLRLKDNDGRFWMLGVKSGKWYYLDGKEWIQAEPPSLKDGKAICILCGFENKLESEVCARCGGNMGDREDFTREFDHKFEEPSGDLDYIHEKDRDLEEKRKDSDVESVRRGNFIFRSLNPISFFSFSGASGLLLGLVLGAFTGASNYFSGIVSIMPSFLKGIQGNLLGGIIYAGLGGALGFVIFGFFGFCEALFVNVISSFIGGIKIRIDRIDKK